MIFRIHFWRGFHDVMHIFVGEHDGALAKSGVLIMRPVEFDLFRASCEDSQFATFEFIDKTEKPANPTEKEIEHERARESARRQQRSERRRY